MLELYVVSNHPGPTASRTSAVRGLASSGAEIGPDDVADGDASDEALGDASAAETREPEGSQNPSKYTAATKAAARIAVRLAHHRELRNLRHDTSPVACVLAPG